MPKKSKKEDQRFEKVVEGFIGVKKSKKTNKGKKYRKPLSFPNLSLDDVVRKVLNTPPPKDDVSE